MKTATRRTLPSLNYSRKAMDFAREQKAADAATIVANAGAEAVTKQAVEMKPAPEPISDLAMMFAGQATFTLENPNTNKRITYRVDRVQDDDRPEVFFVKFLVGQDNENDYQYLGMFTQRAATCFRTTSATRVGQDSDPVKGLRWLLEKLNVSGSFATLPNGIRCVWSCECQRCGRTLTVPSSIDNRLGPECVKKFQRGE